jgi:CHAT domain-containing protein
MIRFTLNQVLTLLRSGTPDERIEFLQRLPPNGFKDAATGLIGSDNPGMVLVALGSLILQYCNGTNPEVGAVLAIAAHQRGIELWETIPDHGGLLLTTLSGFAGAHLKALELLGRSEEQLEAAANYIRRYETLGESENLPSLKVSRIGALVNLRRIDEADAALQDKELLRHPIAGIEATRLKHWVDHYRQDPTKLRSEGKSAPEPMSGKSLLDVMKTAIGLGFEGETGAALKEQINRLDTSNRLDPNDPAQFKQLLTILGKGEDFLTKHTDVKSELTVRARVRNASAVFVHGTPPKDVIEHSLGVLVPSLAWAKQNGIKELENDAWWGLYLCFSRLDRPSDAADALIQLRGNLEGLRLGIRDPMKRGGIFSTYRYLFNALCEQLYQAGRPERLLEAIESSKGRVIADKLTDQSGDIVGDAAIYESVASLPTLTQQHQFHYLSYFVDETCVYAALVTKDGSAHAMEPVAIESATLREAAKTVDPGTWSKAGEATRGRRIPNASRLLSPLVRWLDELLNQGVVTENDHICYSSDENFHNVPLQYLEFRDGILIDSFSLSRVHTAFHLQLCLTRNKNDPPGEYLGVMVPLRQDLARERSDKFLANLEAPLEWLRQHRKNGHSLQLDKATLSSLLHEQLAHRIVHFSTHGWFPKEDEGNPFHDSYLVLAAEDGLPDLNHIMDGQHVGILSPKHIFDANFDFSGSHVSLMACVSGLAREGLAGDTLGLDWAFIQSGASSIVSTHWDVSAAGASAFFTRFYKRWLEDRQSRASAHRETMLELLAKDRTPKSLRRWAAFSLTGDFR